MKFDFKIPEKVIKDIMALAKKKFPDIEGWTFNVAFYDDKTVQLNLFHTFSTGKLKKVISGDNIVGVKTTGIFIRDEFLFNTGEPGITYQRMEMVKTKRMRFILGELYSFDGKVLERKVFDKKFSEVKEK